MQLSICGARFESGGNAAFRIRKNAGCNPGGEPSGTALTALSA